MTGYVIHRHCSLHEWQWQPLTSLPRLSKLILVNMRLKEFPSFRHLTQLQQLELLRCSQTRRQASARLKAAPRPPAVDRALLTTSSNWCSGIPPQLYRQLGLLKVLALTGVHLPLVSALSQLTGLEALSLAGCTDSGVCVLKQCLAGMSSLR